MKRSAKTRAVNWTFFVGISLMILALALCGVGLVWLKESPAYTGIGIAVIVLGIALEGVVLHLFKVGQGLATTEARWENMPSIVVHHGPIIIEGDSR